LGTDAPIVTVPVDVAPSEPSVDADAAAAVSDKIAVSAI
jgi:hypothetical protein